MKLNLRLPLEKHICFPIFLSFILIELKRKSKSTYPSNNENFPWVNDNSSIASNKNWNRGINDDQGLWLRVDYSPRVSGYVIDITSPMIRDRSINQKVIPSQPSTWSQMIDLSPSFLFLLEKEFPHFPRIRTTFLFFLSFFLETSKWCNNRYPLPIKPYQAWPR